MNQLATPGLGSLMAGRWVAGIGQLLLALAGFGMLTTWLLTVIIHQLRELTEDVAPQSTTPVWLGKAGALLFVAAWVWSLVSSWQILRSAHPEETSDVPPRLQ